MKIDKSNFSLILMTLDENSYNGTFNVRYHDKTFNKDIQIDDTAHISEMDDNRKLSDREKSLITQINRLIDKVFSKKGFALTQWTLTYSYNVLSEIKIEYHFDATINQISFNLIEDNMICKKALALSRSVTKRMFKELK
tara:strand:- start:40002 stop:40418 length:417 start_codon:yes stop_codon:yes gene_type:complete